MKKIRLVSAITLTAALSLNVFGSISGSNNLVPVVYADDASQTDATAHSATNASSQPTTSAIDYAKLNSLTGEYSETLKEKKEVQERLNELMNSQNSFISKLHDIDDMIIEYQNKIDDISSRTSQAYKMMDDLEKKVEGAEEKRDEQYEKLKEHIVQAYENNSTSYLETFFDSKDYVEVVNRSEYIQALENYNNKILDDMISTERSFSDQKLLLRGLTEDLNTLDEAYKTEQDVLQQLSDEKEKQISYFNSSINSTQNELSEIEKKEAEQSSQISAMRQASNSSTVIPNVTTKTKLTYNGEPFQWPVPSCVDYNANNRGMDISCVDGSEVVAAVDGIVVMAEYLDELGYTITINHGSNISTSYSHLKSFDVAEGDKVSKGQLIGKSGSTGNATTPHLHFGVVKDGEFVDPLDYYPGLKKAGVGSEKSFEFNR